MDEVGAGLGCAVMDWHARDIVVARDEAVYICGVEGRGACFAYEGQFLVSRDLGMIFIHFVSCRPQIIRPYSPKLPRHHLLSLHPTRLRRIRHRPQLRCNRGQRW